MGTGGAWGVGVLLPVGVTGCAADAHFPELTGQQLGELILPHLTIPPGEATNSIWDLQLSFLGRMFEEQPPLGWVRSGQSHLCGR